jgi:hypothetical protein
VSVRKQSVPVVVRDYKHKSEACEGAVKLLLEGLPASKVGGLITSCPIRPVGDQAVGNERGARPSQASPNDP